MQVMECMGLSAEAAWDYIDEYNSMVQRLDASEAARKVIASASSVRDITNSTMPLYDASPFEYAEDAVSGDTFDLAKTPNEGEPGSWYTNPGSGQMRLYGGDGQPLVDFDFDHDHGQGVPHAHNWAINPLSGKLRRGAGFPMSILP
ncbi:hypothetical protein [Burkholderia sp. 22PA0106]|uniref:hypothetical protein n=1 Tax=Burkholderia sp. 22PA0106 TaxID=3237371 RepID=UPI0039C4AA44